MLNKVVSLLKQLGGDEFVLNPEGSGSIHILEPYGEIGQTLIRWESIEELENIILTFEIK
jgi:hypothetical protein